MGPMTNGRLLARPSTMLKKSLFSPARTHARQDAPFPRLRSRFVQKLNSEANSLECRTLEGLFRSPRFIARANGYTKCGPYLLASSLVAALLSGLFEHPVDDSDVTQSLCQRSSLASFEKFFVIAFKIIRLSCCRGETRRQSTTTSTISTESILIHH